MDCKTSTIEEIHRRDLAPPQMRLKIISINLNDRGQKGHSVTPTPPPPLPPSTSTPTSFSSDTTLVPYVRKPLVLKKAPKLRSFEHMLEALQEKHLPRESSKPLRAEPNGNIPQCNGHCHGQSTSDKESQTEDQKDPSPEGYDSTYIIFVKGINNAFSADKEEVINTIVNILNKHVVSVSSKEHNLFGRDRKRSSKHCMHGIITKGALLAINELLDEGMAEITPQGALQLAQGVTFTLCFHKALLQFAKDLWNSRHAEFIRDAWMSFGGLAAVLVMSATRQ